MKAEPLTIILFSLFLNTISAQVKLQTGAAEVAIPLYSYTDPNNRLSTGISLAYVAGNGLKVNDVASSVGAGWTLDFGGVITRIQNGEPDDQKQYGTFAYPGQTSLGQFYDYVDNYYPNGFLYSEFSTAQLVDNGGGYIPQFDAPRRYKQNPVYVADREQDYFSFSFGGRTGMFVIGKNGVIRSLVDSKLKIEMAPPVDMSANSIITTIPEFYITDEIGIKYIFKDIDLNEILNYKRQYGTNITDLQISYPWTSPSNFTTNIFRGEPKNKFIVGKWFLSEIVNPMTNSKITFTYESYGVDMIGRKTIAATTTGSTTDVSLYLERIKGTARRIKSIQCSSKEKVEFIYSQNNRNDLSFDKSLDEIQIKYDQNVKYKWRFSYGYFVQYEIKPSTDVFTQDEKYKSRLCLQEVKKVGIGDIIQEPPYKFSYFIGEIPALNEFDEVPPMFSISQDHWGYSNWSNTYPYLTEPREDVNYTNVDFNYLAAFVTNPATSKAPLFSYGRGGALKSVQYPHGGVLSFEYEQNSATTTNSQQVSMGGIRVKKTSLYDGIDHSKDIINEYKYLTTGGLSSGWGYEAPSYSNTKDHKIFKCNNGFMGITTAQVASTFLFEFQSRWAVSSVWRMDSYSGLFTQSANATLNSIISSIIVNLLLEIFTPNYIEKTITEHSSISYSVSNPLPFQYSRVIVENKLLTGSTGSTIYEFTSDSEYPIDVPNIVRPFPSRQRFGYWSYGLPKNIEVRDKDNNILKKIENFYTNVKYDLNDANFTSRKWMATKYEYDCDLFPGSSYTSSTNQIDQLTYVPICGRIELAQTKEYFYNAAGQSFFATTEYEYSPTNYHVKKIKTNSSKGELHEQINYYSTDYTLGGAIGQMQTNNMVGIPIGSQTFITKAGNQKYLLSGSTTEYSILSNGDIKPFRTYEFRNDQPVIESQVAFNSNLLNPNSNYYKATGTIDYYKQVGGVTYHADGLPVQLNNEAGNSGSTIYDYDNRLPIASVTNAAIENIAYSSFEAEGSGGWTVIAGSTILNQGGITGIKSLSGTVTKTLTLGNYVITAWSKDNGNITVNGNTGTLLRTIGAWKLYEWNLNSISSVIVAGDNYDELRLFPKGSQMTTQTYDPLFGRTSSCDASNRITYYDYDGLGRPRFIRDEERNVVKMFEYNYKF